MDRTLINIISILVGGAGLFGALTGFNVPELNRTFLGTNPFAVKRDFIESTMKWSFTLVAIIGLLLQLWAEIFGESLSTRLHSLQYYIWFSVAAVMVLVIMMWVLSEFGNRVARWRWQPALVELQREMFNRTRFVIEHDGWDPEHYPNKDTSPPPGGDLAKYKGKNLIEASHRLDQIERLFEVKSIGDPRQRIAKLQPMFEK